METAGEGGAWGIALLAGFLVNNKDADLDTEISENFTVEWTTLNFLSPEEELAASGIFASDDDSLSDIRPNYSHLRGEDEVPPNIGINIECNGEMVLLTGKDNFIFVDVFDAINFDLSAGKGKNIVTRLNGHHAQYTEPLHSGDKVEIRWEEL